MADVFLSYSRRQSDVARRVHDELTGRGKDVWADWDDIPPSSEWRDEIRTGVTEATAFVFLISPESIASGECEHELALAVETGTRIVPVLVAEVDPAAVPEALRRRNWVFLTPDADWDGGIEALARAIDTDLAWAAAHTRLQVAAAAWDTGGRERSRVLRGASLSEAEDLLAREEGRDPAPTPLQREFVRAGRVQATRRQRTLLGAAGVAVAVAATLAILAMIARSDAREKERLAVSRELAIRSGTLLDSDPSLAVLLAREAVRRSGTEEAVDALRRAIQAAPSRGTLIAGRGPVVDTDHAPGGDMVALGNGDGTGQLWDARRRRRVATWRHAAEGPVRVEYAPDGERLLSAGADGTVAVRAAADARELSRLRVGAPVSALAMAPDGERIVVGQETGAQIWRLGATEPQATLRGHDGPVRTVAFSPDGRTVATGSSDGTVRTWDATDGRALLTLRGHGDLVTSVEFRTGGDLLLSAGVDGTARLWNPESGKQESALSSGREPLSAARFSPDGRYVLLVMAAARRAELWDVVGSGQRELTMQGHRDLLRDGEFGRDGRRIVTAGQDGTARVWSARAEDALLAEDPGRKVEAISYDGRRVMQVARRDDGTELRAWDVPSSRPLPAVEVGGPGVGQALLVDGGNVLGAVSGSRLLLWDAASAREIASVEHPGPLLGAAVARGAPRVLTLTETGALRVVDGRTGDVAGELTPPQPATGAVIDATGSWVLFDDARRMLSAWRVGSARPTRLVEVPEGAGYDLSPQGVAVVPDAQGVPRAIDMRTGRLVGTFAERGQFAAIMSTDGKRVVTGGLDETSRVWDTATRRELVVLRGKTLNDAAFSPSGRFVAGAAADRTLTVWEVATGQVVARLGARREDLESIGFSGENAVWTSEGDGAHLLPCDACTDVPGLLRLADERAGRELTADERRQYLRED